MSRRDADKLEERMEAGVLAERQAAAVALLRYPMLHAHGEIAGRRTAEWFALVARHEQPLRRWFADHPGWPLRVSRTQARLVKHRPAGGTANAATRGLVAGGADGSPFTRRRYALLLLTLAALEQCEDQTLVSTLAEKLVSLSANDPRLAPAGPESSLLRLDLSDADHRRDVVAGLRELVRLGVLERVDGDEQRFVADRAGDALYNVQREAASALVQARSAPSLVEDPPQESPEERWRRRLAAAADEAVDRDPPSHAGAGSGRRTTAIRQNLYRRLLDDPVMHLADLEADERAYLNSQRTRLLERIEAATGLFAEVRAEGIALLDVDRTATDALLPRESVTGHVTLLLAEHLAGVAARGRTRVGLGALESHVAGLVKQYGKHWRKDARAPGAETWLTADALGFLRKLDLVRPTPEGAAVDVLPPIARYRVGDVGVGGRNRR